MFNRIFITTITALSLVTTGFAADKSVNSATEKTKPAVTVSQTKINLNKASAEDLEKVQGLNAYKAKAIVAYRKKHGDFKAVEELKDVKGFKRLKEEALKDITSQLTVG